MTLRTKILLIVMLGFVGLTAVVFTFARVSVDQAFEQLEKTSVGHDGAIIQMVYQHELRLLTKTALEWANRQGVRELVNGTGADMLADGLHDPPLIQGNVNLLMILDAEGKQVASRFYDLTGRRAVPLPKSFLDFLAEDSFVRVHHHVESHVTGILPLMEQPMILVSLPILPQESGGLIEGTVIVGRWWGQGDFLRMATKAGLGTYQQYTKDDLAPDFAAAAPHLNRNQPIHTVMLRGTSVAAYVLFDDIYGEPGLILRLMKERDNFLASFAVSSRVGIFTVGAGVFFLIVALVLLEATTLSRMRVLVREIRDIESTKHIAAAKISIKGRDEIGRIAEGVRYVLSALKVNRFRWVRSERRLQNVIEALPTAIVFLDTQTYGIRRVNQRAVELLESDANALLGLPFEELVLHQGGHEGWMTLIHGLENRSETAEISLHRHAAEPLKVTATASELSLDEGKLLIVSFVPTGLSR